MPIEVVSIAAFFLGSAVQAWFLWAEPKRIEEQTREMRTNFTAHNAALTHRVNQLEITVSALMACEKSRIHKKRHPGLPASEA